MFTTFQRALLAVIGGGAVLLALVIAAKGGSASAATPLVIPAPSSGPVAGIVTTGDATVRVRPDIALLNIGAVAQAPTAAEAQAQVAERVARILDRAKSIGVAEKDTKNVGYSIQPQYATGPNQAPRITGYEARQQILLTLRSVDGVGKAIDTLVQNDDALTASVAFSLDDSKPAQADARRLAIQDALAKANAMAQTAGVKVGKVLSVNDLQYAMPVPQPYDAVKGIAAAPAAQVQLPAGQLDITIRVQVQFSIE